MRPLISYDDIVAPEAAPPTPAPAQGAPPPAKKRKGNPNQHKQPYGGGGGGKRGPQAVQHWDDPGNQEPQMMYDEAPVPAAGPAAGPSAGAGTSASNGHHYEEEEEEEEESRELTHEEIWDDSALIDAWNSAAAEYEAFHGPGKKWKSEPVKKSPLWYNVPPATTSKPKGGPSATAPNGTNGAAPATSSTNGGAQTDSTPHNFDTYVPSHDPSLAAAAGSSALAVPGADGAAMLGAGAEMANVGQDEAFSRAMTAMYWSGYWTAVYHCRRNETQNGSTANELEDGVEEEDGAEGEADDDDEMLPAQR
ncbi:hypothetical protein C8Q77DRAFT_8666 [Trametes polyzona]|nr:hypothetical protein C8Q77DRAFT_8666 [Trametes polyzona]